MRSEGYGSWVCVCVCLSVKSHLTSGLLFFMKTLSYTQRATKVKKIVEFSPKLLHYGDRVLPPLDSHTYDQPFFLRITCMHIVHHVMLRCHTVSSLCVLYSSTMIIVEFWLELCILPVIGFYLISPGLTIVLPLADSADYMASMCQ